MKYTIKSIFACLIVLFSTTQIFAQNQGCSPNCSPGVALNFSTGWDEVAGAVIPIGAVDPHWRLMNVPPITGPIPGAAAIPTPPIAYSISPFVAGWNDIPGSRALSMTDQSNFGPNNSNAAQPWRFRRYFCLCQDTEVELNGQIRADDTGQITLFEDGGIPTAFNVSLAPPPNTSNFYTGVNFSQVLFLPAGIYYFEFDLRNTNGVATGFAVQGTMTSAMGTTVYEEQLNCCQRSVITGQKILDVNCNGAFDQGTDGVGSGFVFELVDPTTGAVIATVTSNAFGEFEFDDVPPGTYIVREVPQWGWTGTPPITVTVGVNDAQFVTFYNCPYEPQIFAGCVFGDTIPVQANTYDERGMAIITGQSTDLSTLLATNIQSPLTPNERIVRHTLDAAGTSILPSRTNYHEKPGRNSIENMHSVNIDPFCSGSPHAIVGTINNNNNGNKDVFFAEMSAAGDLTYYADVTNTDDLDEEVNDFIRSNTTTNQELLWVGTRSNNPPGIVQKLLIHKYTGCGAGIQTEYQFSIPNGGIQNTTGQSIIELPSGLPGFQNARYAVTGSVGNEVYILLLNNNLNLIFHRSYDIDNNPETREVGIRLRLIENEIYILGNLDRGFNPNQPDRYNFFLLKLDFDNPSVGVIVAENHIYRMPGGGERVVDVEVRNDEELIVTGISEIDEGGIGNPANGFEAQKTYLMSLDLFGNVQWANQFRLAEGTEPRDLKFNGEEIDVVGYCWVNEIGTFNQYIQRYDEMKVRASATGQLSFNNQCEEPIPVQVIDPEERPYNKIILPTGIPDQTIVYDFGSTRFESKTDFCDRNDPPEPVECDSVMLTQKPAQVQQQDCCFALDYKNNSPGPVYELCLNITGSPAVFSTVLTDPNFVFAITGGGQTLTITSSGSPALPPGIITDAITFCLSGTTGTTGISYLWKDAIGNVVCEAGDEFECGTGNEIDCDFTFQTDCFDVNLIGAATGGTAPYTYDWDIDGDLVYDIINMNPANHTYPPFPASQTYTVTMLVTDAAGVTCTTTKTVTVRDLIPPVINCPNDTTIFIDQGECFATFAPIITVTDDCDDMPTYQCDYTDPTFPKGTTTVTCTATDASGNQSTCTFKVTVVDNEPPTINCSDDIRVSALLCDGGTFVQFPPPVIDDNCPMATYTCSHQSGDFFPCGRTTVTCTVTDMAGNQTSCRFDVIVECECAEIVRVGSACNEDDEDTQDFTIALNSLTGTNNCNVILTNAQTGVTINGYTFIWTGAQVIINGSATITGCPFPDELLFDVTLDCVCPNQEQVECTVEVTVPTQCCKTIEIADESICRDGPLVYVPIEGVGNLCDIQQVNWYVADAPCPPTSWGAPFQTTTYYTDLLLDPQFFNGNVCVYAEVILGSGDGPCAPMLVTNTATITLCPPISCQISSDQEYCYDGTPIMPTVLTGNLSISPSNCPDTIQWYDPNGNPIPGATTLTYQPPALSLPAGSQACKGSFTYRMEVRSKCGVSSCAATITLWNDDAPTGTLVMDPVEPLPLCPGEDLTLRYRPQCTSPTNTWTWFVSSPTNTSYTPITTAGDQNPLYNTNRLYQDTWFKVEKQNGVCPVDVVEIFIPVNAPLTLTSFTATATPVCSPNQVVLNASYQPAPANGCNYIVEWYRNGTLLQTVTTTNLNESYTYAPSDPDLVPGNYYVVVKSSCCNEEIKSQVITIEPPCELAIAGPCYRCNDEIVVLDGIVTNPPSGGTCTFQWYDENGAIPGATGMSLTVAPTQNGPFRFEKICTVGGTTCIKSVVYDLKQCGDPSIPSCPPFVDIIANPIPAGSYGAQIQIETASTADPNGIVDLYAGQTVLLKPGFHAKPNTASAMFIARIAPCQPPSLQEIESRDEQMGEIELRNFPNPFSELTVIQLTLTKATKGVLSIYNLNGQEIYRADRVFDAGQTDVQFQATPFAPGLYYYQFRSEATVISRSMMIVKE